MVNDGLEIERDAYIRRAEAKLTRLFADDPLLVSELLAGLNFNLADSHAESRLQLLRNSNLISSKTFEALIGGGESYKPMFVNEMWDALVRSGVFVRQFRDMPGQGALADHAINLGFLLEHLRDGTFRNLFYPSSYLHHRYAPVVTAIDVKLKNGDSSRGSGFIAKMSQTEQRWLFTCLHNVDPTEVELREITTATGSVITIGEPHLSDRYDLAIFPVSDLVCEDPLVLKDAGDIFDEVYTLGYPRVPGAQPILLGHRGEINAIADLYLQKCPALIVSNLVSPGSSGGPVLDRQGRCVGMVIRWLEGEWADEKARFSAALPGGALIEEFKRLVRA